MPEIFQYDFMLRAFGAGLIIGSIAPLIGIFIVVKRYSLLADTLAHVSLLGVAIALAFGLNPVFGALVISIIAAFGIERLREKRKIFGESILSLFLSGSLALAVVVLGFSRGLNANLFSYLFGSITTVTPGDLWLMGVFGILVLVLMIWLFKKFFLVAYDKDLARASGLPVAALNIALMVAAAVTVALAMRVVGILLVGALMVIPVISALQFGRSFKKSAFLALGFSLLAVISGLTASFYLNLPSGGAIVVACLLIFVASLVFNKARPA